MDNQPQPAPMEPQPGPGPVASPPQSPLTTNVPSQPPIMNAIQPPKKKRTGLIVGIILGSIGLLLLIGAALFYFLWWQNPQRMVEDAIIGLFRSQNIAQKGTITMKNENFTATVNYDASRDGNANTKATATLKFDFTQFDSPVEIQAEGIYSQDGVLYVKTGNLSEAVDQLIEVQAEESASYYSSLDATARQQYIADVKTQSKKLLDPVIKKIDDQWLKFSPDENTEDSNAQCVSEVVNTLSSDKNAAQEVYDVYRKNSFIEVAKEVAKRDNTRGFELTINKDLAKAFTSDLAVTTVGKQLKECDIDTEDVLDAQTADTDVATTFTIWVAPLTHQMTEAELTAKGDATSLDASIKFNKNTASAIDPPKDAKDIKDVMKEMQQTYNDSMSSALLEESGVYNYSDTYVSNPATEV